MADCKIAETPMSAIETLKVEDGGLSADATRYRRVIGKLQYLSFTRPDICFSVNKLSQFMQTPSETHWKVVKWELRYLQGTVHFGLRLMSRNSLSLHVYSDADWAGDASDRASTTSYLLFLGKNPMTWSSKNQRTIAHSSTEAEYREVASSFAETNWVTNLLAEPQLKLHSVPTIYRYNVGAT
ncbi:uncharacterized mitochondrial protein AtMg00810-like [Solanum tuberosum]|uniref:uncharacterized mitochondrial protein AtMg00810-like n=1 Tax=Solanum tuberosum TaxID=4113 RepID=UPI00073A4FDA|nr:PREDICTED: uncharacterized mitochondrial protein AtMg00810-like [Solanum tuberosum]